MMEDSIIDIIDPFEASVLGLPLSLINQICSRTANEYQRKVTMLSIEYPKSEQQVETQSGLLKIGYLSPDFTDHPIGLLFNNLCSYHDKSKFQSIGLCLQRHSDEVAKTIYQSFDNLVDLTNLSDKKAIETIQTLNLDILVDMVGHTKGGRPAILAAKPAKKIVSWLGANSTTGFQTVDYYLGNQYQFTNAFQDYFTETIIRLENNSISRVPFVKPAASNRPQRSDYHLPLDSIVFVCFCQHYRVDRVVLACWSKLLHAVKDSVLWLQGGNPIAENNICDYLQTLGVNPNRIVFAPKEKLTTRWYHTLGDLWLDTIHFSSLTSIMICAGSNLPFICYQGDRPESRASYAIAKELNMPELIATDVDEYVNKALKVVETESNLQQVRQKLEMQVEQSILFKPERYIKTLEKAFITISES